MYINNLSGINDVSQANLDNTNPFFVSNVFNQYVTDYELNLLQNKSIDEVNKILTDFIIEVNTRMQLSKCTNEQFKQTLTNYFNNESDTVRNNRLSNIKLGSSDVTTNYKKGIVANMLTNIYSAVLNKDCEIIGNSSPGINKTSDATQNTTNIIKGISNTYLIIGGIALVGGFLLMRK